MMSSLTTPLVDRQAAVLGTACEALLTFAACRAGPDSKFPPDAGPAVLASLVAQRSKRAQDPVTQDAAGRALVSWLDGFRGGVSHVGTFGSGLAGFFAGAQAARGFHPRLAPLVDQLRASLAAWSAAGHWRTEAVGWEDYDLITGPAGLVLALATDPACPPECVVPALSHLAALGDAVDLRRLRVGAYRDDELLGWNFGRINTGLGHGVPGVAAALRAACDIGGVRDELAAPLGRVSCWLVAHSFVDARGVRTWTGGSLDGRPPPPGASHRQAWCYGTPGVSWTLWDAGRVLGDCALQAFAAEAMRSFCAAWDDEFYIDDGPKISDILGVCHGAAGTLAIADAFTRHAGLDEAVRLRDHLERYVLDRFDEVRQLAEQDMSLLNGASGVLAVLLTVQGGLRGWLTQLALR